MCMLGDSGLDLYEKAIVNGGIHCASFTNLKLLYNIP
jgi:hypothetical protein